MLMIGCGGFLFGGKRMNSADIVWILVSSALVLVMTPGLAFFYGGMVKRKNVINTMMACVFIMGMASIMWVLFGYSLSFSGDIAGIIGNFNWFGLNGVGGLLAWMLIEKLHTGSNQRRPEPHTSQRQDNRPRDGLRKPAGVDGIRPRKRYASDRASKNSAYPYHHR